VSHIEIGVRDLRNRTAQVIDAVTAGERVTLTVRGEPVADIVPHGRRRARWLSGLQLGEQLTDRAADPGLRGGARRARRSDAGRAVSRPAAGLLDTSIFIARDTGRPVGDLPDRVAVSVVTIGELQLGVLHAQDGSTRARRAETLALARMADPIPISEAVMVRWAQLVADCRAAGIHRTVKLTDALIAGLRSSTACRSSHKTMTSMRCHRPTARSWSPRSDRRLRGLREGADNRVRVRSD
jgi:prevent-host-death family protein